MLHALTCLILTTSVFSQAAPTPATTRAAAKGPTSAAAALDQAAAAYEFGDINQMVQLSRLVADGGVTATLAQRAEGYRMLGIGLSLTGRREGAEVAFVELLKRNPNATLNRANTRPEVVDFFDDVRRRRPKKLLVWNFLPPFGQFQNGAPKRGWLILGVGALATGTTLTSFALLKSAKRAGDTCPNAPCDTYKTINIISGAALIATYLYGVIDGIAGYAGNDALVEPRLSFGIFPGGGTLRLTF